MKIAVSATGGSMNAKMSEQFGRCAYFIIIDSETMKWMPVLNPAVGARGGAGIEASKLIADNGVEVVLTGSVGPNAEAALKAAGIKIVTGFSGTKTVQEVVEEYLKGKK